MSLFEIKNLKVYAENNDKFLRIVDGISFDIKENEVVSLFGECGCGKTTTAHAIMGIVQALPGVIEGEIYLNGNGNLLSGLDKMSQVRNKDGKLVIEKDVKRWNRIYEERMKKVRGKRLFLVMQGAKSSLNPFYKVNDQIKIVSWLREEREVNDILEKLGIRDKKDQYPHRLSGGECQRVLLAMAFASQTKLLIVDEPTVGIDVLLKDEMVKLLKEYKEKGNSSILLISHDFELIKEIADRIVVMYSGKIIEAGEKKEIIENPKHPYTKMLIKSWEPPPEKNKPLFVNKCAILSFDREYKGCRFYSRCEEMVKDKKCLSEESDNIHWCKV